MPKKKKPIHYIDNKMFFTVMLKFHTGCEEARAANKPLPEIPNYVGECIMKISVRLATRPNFVGYSYKDEMISDGIENCLTYIHNFNPEKSSNPFAYFTQIIYYAFLRRIQKEKKQVYIKHKSLENAMVMNTLVDMALEDRAHFQTTFSVVNDKMNDFVKKFEAKNIPIAKPKRGIEVFIGDDNE